jgi:hypothetical protein
MQLFAAGQETEARLALITDGKVEALAGPAVSAVRAPAASAASARGDDLRSAVRWVLPVTAILRE